MPIDLPEHVTSRRRDGRREVLLHRSMAVIADDKIEIKSARGTVILPIIGILLAGGAMTWMARSGSSLPFWALVTMLIIALIIVPFSVISLISSIIGADVVVDAKKGSATWQQGFLGMGIGTKELVPFAKIDHLEVAIEGDEPNRWRGETDSLRQFSLTLVKKSGKRLSLAQVPVPAYGQADGMDRTLAVGNAVAQLTGSTVTLPEGWELVEIDTRTGDTVTPTAPATPARPATPGRKRGRRTRNA